MTQSSMQDRASSARVVGTLGDAPKLVLLRTTPQSQGTTPRYAPDGKLLTLQFDVHPDHAPALRSAIDDFTSIIGTRMESKYDYETEDALVRASIAIARLRAAVFAAVPEGDKKFPTRKGRT